MHFERSWSVGLKDAPAALIIGTLCDREEVKKYIVASPPAPITSLCAAFTKTLGRVFLRRGLLDVSRLCESVVLHPRTCLLTCSRSL